jgi:hypothetical protein
MSLLSGALAILAVAVVCSAARASLPAANGFVQCSTKAGNITSPTSCTGDANNGSVTYSPFAGLNAFADGQGLVDNSGVFGVLNYSFEVIGGKPGDVVPIDVDTVLSAVPISIGSVFSETLVTGDTSTGVTICSSGCGVGSGVTGFTGTLQVNAVSGTVYLNGVHLEVDVIGALGGTTDFDGGTASVDPHVYVDPAFPNAGAYTVLLSDGIGNQLPGVPEPATWAVLVLGVAMIGFAARRRREGAAVAV